MKPTTKQRHSFSLRISSATLEQAKRVAQEEGLSLNHFVSLAVAERMSRLEHSYWLKRQATANQRREYYSGNRWPAVASGR